MDRERLTITLRRDIIKQVDKSIDGVRIRNRSHAIEYFLSKGFGPKVSQALILAGGKGIKMRPFTYEMPKTMIPVHGRPILEHIIEHIREFNIRDIIISVDYLGEKIREYFGDGSKLGVRITYIENDKPTGNAPPLKLARNFLSGNPFILWHGDVLADIDLMDLIDFHEEHKKLVTMALTSVIDPSEYGAVRLHGNNIVDFQEKAGKGPDVSRLINAGIYVVDPSAIEYIPKKQVSYLEKDVLPELIKKNNLCGYVFEGKWYDVSTPAIYAEVLKKWKK
jgi:NDP-sugar pyrophosphorylase family protein